MRKAEVIAAIPEKFLREWRRYQEGEFGSHSFTMIHSCGLPLIVRKSYHSIKAIELKRISRYTHRLELFTFTRADGWDNLSWTLRRKRCTMGRDNLPYPDLLKQKRNCPKCGDRMVKFPAFEWQRKIANDYYLCLACKHREQITFDPNKLSPADFAKDDFDKMHVCMQGYIGISETEISVNNTDDTKQ